MQPWMLDLSYPPDVLGQREPIEPMFLDIHAADALIKG